MLVKPDVFGNCPHLGTFPTWIAPGDVKDLDSKQGLNGTDKLDYKRRHHQLYCLTDTQVKKLWSYGLSQC